MICLEPRQSDTPRFPVSSLTQIESWRLATGLQGRDMLVAARQTTMVSRLPTRAPESFVKHLESGERGILTMYGHKCVLHRI
jgi:hypothetical protein